MRRLSGTHSAAVRAAVAACVVASLGLSLVAVAGGQAWHRVESGLLLVFSVLVGLLLLKAAVVFVSVGLRLVLSVGG